MKFKNKHELHNDDDKFVLTLISCRDVIL